MIPVPPDVPGHEPVVYAKDQPQYLQLPAHNVIEDGIERVVTRWRLTDDERVRIAAGADIWLEVMTFGNPLQPIRISTECFTQPIGEPS